MWVLDTGSVVWGAHSVFGACREECADLIDDRRVVEHMGQIERLSEMLLCLARLLVKLQDPPELEMCLQATGEIIDTFRIRE